MNLQKLKQSNLFNCLEYKPIKKVMEGFSVINSKPQISPEEDLIDFYLGSHALTLFENKVGNTTELTSEQEQLVVGIINSMHNIFYRMFTYLMLISIGESRHSKITNHLTEINNIFGEDLFKFITSIKNTGRESSRNKFLQEDRILITYMEYCNWCFVNCFQGTHSYGGSKWKNISDKCLQVLKGKISPYTMIDTSWAMVHNTGSIFNKNTIYSNPIGTRSLIQLLDVQRAGAIPSYIVHKEKYIKLGIPSIYPVSCHLSKLEEIKNIFNLHNIDDYISVEDICNAGALDGIFSKHKLKPNTKFKPTNKSFDIGIEKFQCLRRIL